MNKTKIIKLINQRISELSIIPPFLGSNYSNEQIATEVKAHQRAIEILRDILDIIEEKKVEAKEMENEYYI